MLQRGCGDRDLPCPCPDLPGRKRKERQGKKRHRARKTEGRHQQENGGKERRVKVHGALLSASFMVFEVV